MPDLRQENADAAAEVLIPSNAGFEVRTATVDVSSRDSVHALSLSRFMVRGQSGQRSRAETGIEQMMASSQEHSEQDIVRLPPDEERSIVHQALTDHYRKTLDEPIPALGNQTPREAVKTAKGRKKVIAWLKRLENQSAQPRPEDPMGAYDFTWLWRELGVGDERR